MNLRKLTGRIGTLAFAALVSGCSLFGTSSTPPIDPPPSSVAEEAETLPASAAVAENTFNASLFVRDADGYIVPLGVRLPFDTPDVAKRTLQYMVKGGPGDALLPEGFSNVLPAGTEVLSLNIDAGMKTATVDFNELFTAYEAEEERDILEAVTWALTGYPSVEYVQLWVEGKALKEMPVAGTPLHGPLSRSFGINIERAPGVDFTRATPVTLYFLNQTADNFTYFVPVTRLIDWTEDAASAAVAELIKGPSAYSRLEAVFLPIEGDTRVTVDGEYVRVDLDSSLAGSSGAFPAEGLQAMVLTLTETTPAKGVKITVDGKTRVTATDQQNYGAYPVTRPKVVNPLEL